jgi:hypothetical protein
LPISREDQKFLAEAAAEIRSRLQRAALDTMVVGRKLLEVHSRLRAQRRFRSWLKSEAGPGLGRSTAYRYMAVAEAFSDLSGDIIRTISDGTLHALTQPGVPKSLMEYVAEQAADGKGMSPVDTLKLIDDFKKGEYETPRGYLIAPNPPRPAVDPAAVHAADNWLALDATLHPDVLITMKREVDTENGESVVHVTVYEPEGKRRGTARRTLEEAIVELGGMKRMKVCRTCLQPKPHHEFSRLKESADGRNRACLACERERVAAANGPDERVKRIVRGRL